MVWSMSTVRVPKIDNLSMSHKATRLKLNVSMTVLMKDIYKVQAVYMSKTTLINSVIWVNDVFHID